MFLLKLRIQFQTAFLLLLISNYGPVKSQVHTASANSSYGSVNFAHETCQMETLSSKDFQNFYPTEKFVNKNGVLELLVRFMGIADGHIALSVNTTDINPRNASYVISLGSYNNRVSEITRGGSTLQFKINTPGIMSELQYRGFLIRYNPSTGGIYVFAEGSELPLLHLVDPNPLQINYFSFSTWTNRVIQVAFNCQPKDSHSSFQQKSDANEEETSRSTPRQSKS